MYLRALVLLGLLPFFATAADVLTPVSVCEVLSDLPAHEGKEVAVLGRYSFRRDGRWIGEESCGGSSNGSGGPAMLWLTENSDAGPKPPGNFELDAGALNRKFIDLIKHTALGKFRFGTQDYDRWAVVYGRIVVRKGEEAKKAPAELVFRGSGVIIFLTTER
jgi:hypothetical protein